VKTKSKYEVAICCFAMGVIIKSEKFREIRVASTKVIKVKFRLTKWYEFTIKAIFGTYARSVSTVL